MLAGQNHNIRISNKSFESVARSKNVLTTLTNQNFVREEIKRRLNSGNTCYCSVQNLLSFCFPSTLSLTLRGEYRLTVFNISMPSKIFGHNRKKVTGNWRKLRSERLHGLYTSPDIIRMHGIKINWCHYFNFIHILPDLYMFRAHRPIFRRVRTAVHTTIGSWWYNK
jgi:hypothetical protein